jgi:FtsH-binding integral membrane protein
MIRLKKSFTQKDDIYSLPLTVVGILHFVFLLIYDFNRLEKAMARGDESWETAVQLSLSIYLDIINLFLLLLEYLAHEA